MTAHLRVERDRCAVNGISGPPLPTPRAREAGSAGDGRTNGNSLPCRHMREGYSRWKSQLGCRPSDRNLAHLKGSGENKVSGADKNSEMKVEMGGSDGIMIGEASKALAFTLSEMGARRKSELRNMI